MQLLHGALAAVTGGGSNGSFVVGADDSTALRLIRPAILRLAGALWQAGLGSEAAGAGMHRLKDASASAECLESVPAAYL